MSQKQFISLTVNGQTHSRSVPASMTLLSFLRDELNLTGSKQGCDLGECGCCSVLLDGVPVLSCMTLAIATQGQSITTIEGISDGPLLHPVQERMVADGAIQCGFCTPAMVINGVHLVEHNDTPCPEEIKQCVSATICRCTGYTKIETAINNAAEMIREGANFKPRSKGACCD